MDTQRFRPLLTAQGPFVSIFFDDSHDTADADAQIERRWQDIRRALTRQGADQRACDAIEVAIRDERPVIGRRGRGLIATSDGVLVDVLLPSPPTLPVVRMSDYPYLLSLLGTDIWRPDYVFAAVDHEGADLTVHRDGVLSTETVSGEGYPVHKAATAGLNGYNDFQHSTEEAIRMNVRAVADRLTRLVDDTEARIVFVCGAVRPRTEVVAALPHRIATWVAQLHAGAQGKRADEAEFADQVHDVFVQRDRDAIQEAANVFRRERGRADGLAIEGVAAVCGALRDGNVATLLVGDLADQTVLTGASRTTVAPDAVVLSELGEPPCRVVRADEALPFAAVAVGAVIVQAAPELALADGIGVVRRYVDALTDRSRTDGAVRTQPAD